MGCTAFIAGAGAGKTTFLVESAYSRSLIGQRVLIATFTNSNAAEIKNAFYRIKGCVPGGVAIMTWFSFLLCHGVRPYRHSCLKDRISGLHFDEGAVQTGRARKGECGYYLRRGSNDVHSGRLAELAVDTDAQYDGMVARRVGKVFDAVLIDEAQDLAGYDFEFITRLVEDCRQVILVGDPRQTTYRTNYGNKNASYADVFAFLSNKCGIEADTATLSRTHRCSDPVIGLANAVYPEYEPMRSCASYADAHQAVELIRPDHVEDYLEKYGAVQLRWSKSTKCSGKTPVMNMGDSKGLTFDRVLVYPTRPMINWLSGVNGDLKPKARAMLYVAITRARLSAAFVMKDTPDLVREGLCWWVP